jgi:SAM-dependent methyltransferase
VNRHDVRHQFGASAEAYLTSAPHARTGDLEELLGRVSGPLPLGVDAACGAGHSAFALAAAAERVIALDLTPEMLEVTAREAAVRGIKGIETVLGDAQAMPLEDACADIVLCRTAAHHFREPARFLAEAARILKPGGWLALIDTISPEDEGAGRGLNEIEAIRDPSHACSLSASAWRRQITNAGFEIIHENASEAKEIEFQSWVKRMNVPTADRVRLAAMIRDSVGALREALRPLEDPFRFHLPEGRFLARLPG